MVFVSIERRRSPVRVEGLDKVRRWSWFSSCNRFDSYWRWYNGVAVLSLFLSTKVTTSQKVFFPLTKIAARQDGDKKGIL